MQLFQCRRCGQMLFFENTLCESCGAMLGFDPAVADLRTLDAAPAQEGVWQAVGAPEATFRFCANAAQGGCNWLVPAASADCFCRACRHNRTIPDLTIPQNLTAWRRLEQAKHHLFYQLIKLGLPLPDRGDSPTGLAFDFLANDATPGLVVTGHADGLITLNLQEADDAERERIRSAMHEPYRALLGHFRHEIAHFYWDALVRDGGRLEQFRAVFGDERQDYAAALQAHYNGGTPAGWQNAFISEYATSHPWEDFAETWAHYLHIVDTLETAAAFAIAIHPRKADNPDLHAEITRNPYRAPSATALIDEWIPLTFALNSLNRSMGLNDLYPFILTPTVVEKLEFIRALVQPAPA